jgi:hypothetical protein
MKSARAIFVIIALLCVVLPSYAIEAFMAFDVTNQKMYTVVRNEYRDDIWANVTYLQSDTGGYIGQCNVLWPSADQCVAEASLWPVDVGRAANMVDGAENVITSQIVLYTGADRTETYDTLTVTDTLVAHVSPNRTEGHYSYRAETGCVPVMPDTIRINSAFCAWVCHGSYVIPIACENPNYTPELLQVSVANGCAPTGSEYPTHCNNPLCARVDPRVFSWFKRVFPNCRLYLTLTYCIADPGCVCIWRSDFYLPVEILGFSRMVGDGRVTLNWQTGSETGQNTFIVTRCEQRDGIYETVHAEDGVGGATGYNYGWTDLQVVNGRTYYYKLHVMDADGQHVYNVNGVPVILEATPRAGGEVPSAYSLWQNYPNPFNSQTNFTFAVPEAGHVTLKVFDLLGRGVATVVDRDLTADAYTVSWSADGLPAGVYMYTLTSGEFSQTKKMLYLK